MIVRTAKKIANAESGLYDWVFMRGYSAYKTEQNAIMQDIETALYEFQNDCYWALDNGIDWLTRLGYHNQKKLLDNDVQNTINNRYGVLQLSDFQSNVIGREYSCKCNVYTIYSTESIPVNYTIEV